MGFNGAALVYALMHVGIMLTMLLLSGGMPSVFRSHFFTLTVVLFLMISLLVVLKGRLYRRAVLAACGVAAFFAAFVLVKFVLYIDLMEITPFIIRLFGNVFLAILVLVYFAPQRLAFVDSLYVALIVVMLHAVIAFVGWWALSSRLDPVLHDYINVKTFYFLFFYGGDSWDGMAKGVVNLLGLEFSRNQGVFWEPGILQMYMNILFFMASRIKRSLLVSVMSALVIISTWSTVGYVVLSAQMAHLFFQYKGNVKSWLFLLPALPVAFFLVTSNLDQKFAGTSAGSAYARTLDAVSAVQVVYQYPFVGVPLDWRILMSKLRSNKTEVDMGGYNEGTDVSVSNSIAIVFMLFGVPLGLYILYGFFFQNVFPAYNGLFFVIIITSLWSEPLGLFVFPLVLLLSHWVWSPCKSPSGVTNNCRI